MVIYLWNVSLLNELIRSPLKTFFKKNRFGNENVVTQDLWTTERLLHKLRAFKKDNLVITA